MFARPWEPLVPQELQQQMTQVAGTADPADVGLLGFIAVFNGTDLGYCTFGGFSRNVDKVPFDSVRGAVAVPIKTRTRRVSVEVTFTCYSHKDPAVIALWNGGAAGVDGTVTTGPLTFFLEGEAGETGLKLDLPSVDLEGTDFDGSFGSDFIGLNFTATAVLAEGSAALATLSTLAATP